MIIGNFMPRGSSVVHGYRIMVSFPPEFMVYIKIG